MELLVKWNEKEGDSGVVAVSSRVRLARNIKKYPFPERMSGADRRALLIEVDNALKPFGFTSFELTGADKTTVRALMERRQISPEFAESDDTRSVVLSGDESVSIMVNEEDHLRIQALGSGFCLDECLDKALDTDEKLDEKLSFAFNESLGYLTCCPTNLGTALRASVMLHLPSLTVSGAMRPVAANCGKLGLAVRGLYGEGTNAQGSMYQISNQLTLGFSESQLVERLKDTVKQIIKLEESQRAAVHRHNKTALEDRIWRAVGLLSNARLMPLDEAMNLLSEIRIGVGLGLVKQPDILNLNRLLCSIQPACIEMAFGRGQSRAMIDENRATLFRDAFKDEEQKEGKSK